MTGVGVVGRGRLRVSLACPDSEWLDPRRNVFELGGKLPPALRQGLEGTLRGAARAWKVAAGNSPGLVLDSANAYAALRSGASPKQPDMEALGITQVPGDPTARACLAACIDLILSGATQTDAGHKQLVALAGAIGVIDPKLAKTVLVAVQTAQAGPSAQSQQQWVNPTGGALRGYDPKYGDGTFGAGRRDSKGNRYAHEGQDYLAAPGQSVVAIIAGKVTKIGFPYKGNFTIKYVEIASPLGYVVREFYVDPQVIIHVGSSVAAGQRIGTHQSLSAISPGMPEHVHVEIRMGGVPIDPRTLIP